MSAPLSRLIFGTVLILSFFTSRGEAALVTYMFTNYTSNLNTSVTPDSGSVAANVTAGNLTDNVDGAGANAAFSSTTDAFFARSPTTPAAFTSTSYVSFTIAPQAGYSLNLTSLTFQLAASSDATGTYTMNEALRTSSDSYATNLHATNFTVPANTNTGTVTFTNYNVPLTASQFQSLTSTLEFRFYFWDDSSATDDIVRFNDLTLNGTLMAIPEPSTWVLLLGATSLGYLARRRNLAKSVTVE